MLKTSRPLWNHCVGWIRTVDPGRGLALVCCPESGYESDVFVHGKCADVEALAVDDCVAFEIHLNAQGLPQASIPLWKLVGWNGTGEPARFGEYQGTVNAVLSDNTGLIQCPEVVAAHGIEPCVQEHAMHSCGLVVGDLVTFDVCLDSSGNPQVSAPFWKCCTHSHALPQKSVSEVCAPQIADAIMLAGPEQIASDVGIWPGDGAIGAWSEVGSGETWQATGDEEVWRDDGKTCWIEANDINDATAVDTSWSQEQHESQEQSAPAQLVTLDAIHVGTVRSVDITQRYCMVACAGSGFDHDIYVHDTVVQTEALTAGDVVAFKVTVNGLGLPQAATPLWKLVGPSGSSETEGFGDFQGKVGLVLPNGCAFVECMEVSTAYGYDVYANESIMTTCKLVSGDAVAFNLHMGTNGKPQMLAPVWKCCSNDAWTPEAVSSFTQETRAPVGVVVPPRMPAITDTTAWHVSNSASATSDHACQSDVSSWDPKQGRLSQHFYIGTVKSIDSANGCSYVDEGHSAFETELCVPHTVVPVEDIAVDDIIAFKVHVDAQGIPQAATPWWKLMGWTGQGDPSQFGKYQGHISAVLPRGFAFVHCPDISSAFGYDAFIHETVMAECSPLVIGDTIAFNIHVGSFGRPQVIAPLWKCYAKDNLAQSPVSEVQLAQTPSVMIPQLAADIAEQIQSAASSQWQASDDVAPGELISDSDWQNMTGIACPAFGEHNEEEALNLQVQDASFAASEGLSGFGQSSDQGNLYVGAVKEVNIACRCSTVVCPDSVLVGDVYILASVADPRTLSLNDVLAFGVQLDSQGQNQALAPAWKLAGWDGKGAPFFGRYIGRVRKVLPKGGGFVESPRVTAEYALDAYIQDKIVSLCSLAVGDVISFNVQVGPSGRPQLLAPCWKQCAVEDPMEALGSAGNADQDQQAAQMITPGQPHEATAVQIAPPCVISSGKVWSTQISATTEDCDTPPERIDQGWTIVQDAEQGNLYMGSVNSVNAARGFSTVVCPDSGFECDVYVHCSVVDPQLLVVDEVLAFRICVSAQGLPQAAAPIWKLRGWSGIDSPAWGQYVGHVSELQAHGSAYVDCPEAVTAYGLPPLIHEGVMTACGLKVGDMIAFNVHVDASGRPQVPAPCWKCCAQETLNNSMFTSAVSEQEASAEQGNPANADLQLGQPKVTPPWRRKQVQEDDDAEEGDDDQRGFVDPHYEGRDVHACDMRVSASLVHDSRNVCIEDMTEQRSKETQDDQDEHQDAEQTMADLGHLTLAQEVSVQITQPIQELEVEHFSAAFVADYQPKYRVASDVKDLHIGIVKTADEIQGFSTVCCAQSEFSVSIDVHHSVVDPEVLAPDDVIACKIQVDSVGNPRAAAPFWKLMGWIGEGGPMKFGEFQGQIQTILPNGSGFVKCPEVYARHCLDASIHDSVMASCALVPGDSIAFNLYVGPSGKPQVSFPIWRYCFVSEDVCTIAPLGGAVEGMGSAALLVLPPTESGGIEGGNGGSDGVELEPAALRRKELPRPPTREVPVAVISSDLSGDALETGNVGRAQNLDISALVADADDVATACNLSSVQIVELNPLMFPTGESDEGKLPEKRCVDAPVDSQKSMKRARLPSMITEDL